MSRDFRLYLQDVLDSCEKIEHYTDGMTFDEFMSDPKTVDAVVRNLEIIGEAVKSLPSEIIELKPAVEWKEIARLRDLITHHYFKIKFTIVWDIIQNRLDELEVAVGELLAQLPEKQ